MDKSLKQLSDKVLTQEYNKLYGCTSKSEIARLKLIIDEFARRKLPLPGSERAKESQGGKKPKVTYKPKKIEKGFLGNVIIAEDDKRISTIMASQLRTIRLNPSVFSNGLLALQMAQKEMPDLMILDEVMPGANGTTVCSRVRALPGGADIPILLVTGHSDKKTVMSAMMSGITELVKKPFDIKDLVERVKKAVNYEKLLEEEKNRLKVSSGETEKTDAQEPEQQTSQPESGENAAPAEPEPQPSEENTSNEPPQNPES